MEDIDNSQGDRIGAVYVKLASFNLKDHKHEAARAYDIVADYYNMKKFFKRGDVVAINNTLERYQLLLTREILQSLLVVSRNMIDRKTGDRVGGVYVKLVSCHLKLDHKHEVAHAYNIAAE
ncbi:hypothetical protein H5410_059752 [Solanum commersonii]|uniref:Uncharacterized protein n=1 Tax=Solanum commersonii TaxID=4109 RepID=A0A9J5W3D3_SOLCO|nr:hypothetical protein H5410_059752 [Solanum commersonii]